MPFVTGSSLTTGAGTASPFQTIERKDVGLTLRVKPQIGENGTVRMVIYQENSSVVSTSTLSGPTTDKSAVETNVVVDDGQIMVLGGLMKDEYTGNIDKVPLLGDIPYIGALFRADNRKRVKSNLLVFLRPVVMRDQVAASALSIDRYDAIRAVQQGMESPSYQTPVLPPFNAPAPGRIAPTIPAPLSERTQPAPRDPSTLPPSNPPVVPPSAPASTPSN